MKRRETTSEISCGVLAALVFLVSLPKAVWNLALENLERFPFVLCTVCSRGTPEPKNASTAAFPAALAIFTAALAVFPASLGFGGFSPRAAV